MSGAKRIRYIASALSALLLIGCGNPVLPPSTQPIAKTSAVQTGVRSLQQVANTTERLGKKKLARCRRSATFSQNSGTRKLLSTGASWSWWLYYSDESSDPTATDPEEIHGTVTSSAGIIPSSVHTSVSGITNSLVSHSVDGSGSYDDWYNLDPTSLTPSSHVTATLSATDGAGDRIGGTVDELLLYYTQEFQPSSSDTKLSQCQLLVVDGGLESWTLTIDGQTLATGSGTRAITWDGRINGQMLTPGAHVVDIQDSAGAWIEDSVTIDEPIGLQLADKAFSPTSTGQPTEQSSKPTDAAAITASGKWTLSVDGNPGSFTKTDGSSWDGTGQGNSTFVWNGRINNAILPDGDYTLRLHEDGAQDATSTVTIDTVKPKIRSVSVTKIEPATDGSHNWLYTLTVNASDVTNNGVSSGIDDKSGKVISCNDSFQQPEPSASSTQADQYLIKADLTPANIPDLNFSVRISDNAGNISDSQKGTLSEDLAYVGLGLDQNNECSTTGATAPQYSVQSLGESWQDGGVGAAAGELAIYAEQSCLEPIDPKIPNKPFFYVDGTTTYHYGLGLAFRPKNGQRPTPVSNNILLSLPVEVDFISASGTVQYAALKTALHGSTNDGVAGSVTWDGRKQSPTFNLAPTGPFKVKVKYGPDLGVDLDFGSGIPGTLLPPHQDETALQGFRVINNWDGQAWGPARPGTKEEVLKVFRTMKNYLGPAGTVVKGTTTTDEWHHIVERYQIAFDVNALNSTFNVVRVPKTLHTAVSNYYSRPDPETTGSRTESVRDWLKREHGNDFAFQYNFGLGVLKKNGWTFKSQGD